VRLLVPTKTLEQHLQNELAREGLVFRRSVIQTLSAFVDRHVRDFPQAPDPVIYLLAEEAAARVDRPEFRRVAHLPGFCARLARTVLEFSAAGCDSSRLAASLPQGPFANAFLAVYEEVERSLDRRGLLLRSKRLECAAARIHAEGLEGIRAIWLDGFHALPDPELAVIRALGRHAEVTLTLGDGEATEELRGRLAGMGFREERLSRKRGAPAIRLVTSPRIEREVEEIARRILEQASAGRPFREMAIIVRSEQPYVPLLRGTLERFGVPARFYFDADARQHAAIRFLSGAIDAMLGEWDHAATMAALRLAPRFADSARLDALDFAVREQIPNSGLGGLKALLTDAQSPLTHVIDDLGALEEWRSFELSPLDWAERFRTLRGLFHPQRPEAGNHEMALVWRSQATALDLFDTALSEAAQALDPGIVIPLTAYWKAVKAVLRLKPLRVDDGRRNVVHVLSAQEARQWAIPVVFVCGLVEKQFPQMHRQDSFFDDAARYRLQAAGVRLRTAEEFEREERALFDSAITRATMLVTLSYPEFDARGDRNLRSLFLEGLGMSPEESRVVRPKPGSVYVLPPAVIRSAEMFPILRQRTGRVSASGLESFRQCPFQYFGRHTLRLREAPPGPEDRLDFRRQGEIVHGVLAEWLALRQPIGPIFDRVFAKFCEENRIPPGYHTERLRNGMEEDLERFASDEQWPAARFRHEAEKEFEFALAEDLQLAGRIDRIDRDEEGHVYVFDYKYSAPERVKAMCDSNPWQAPIYVLAAERLLGCPPSGMFFIGVKKEVQYVGWSDDGPPGADPVPGEWRNETLPRLLAMADEIRAGRIAPSPADRNKCRFCDSKDVCRIEVSRPAAVAEAV
jgi:hypothetical protein